MKNHTRAFVLVAAQSIGLGLRRTCEKRLNIIPSMGKTVVYRFDVSIQRYPAELRMVITAATARDVAVDLTAWIHGTAGG